MSQKYLNSREEIKNFAENMQTEGSLDDIKKMKFQDNQTIAIPGYFKCQYSSYGDLLNTFMNAGSSKDVKSMLIFANKVVVGSDDENSGRTYFEELERTLKALKAARGKMTLGFHEYPLLDYALELIDGLYYTCDECGTHMLGEEAFLKRFINIDGYPYWYNFFADNAEIIKMHEIVIEIFGKDVLDKRRNH